MDNAPIQFDDDPNEPGDGTARIVVDMNSLGGNKCVPLVECAPIPTVAKLSSDRLPPAKPEPTGLSPVEQAVARPTITSAVDYCTEEIEKQAVAADEESECIQRQELRLQKRYQHAADQPHLYSLRFRLPAVIEDRISSVRWITAQWKDEPISDAYSAFGKGWGPSPFLAQRFDDGVLHVTVQDEHCRCRIASAPLPNGAVEQWKDGTPPYCMSTGPGEEERKCVPDLLAEYGPHPVLDSAMGKWVDMTYRVQAGRATPATIEVWQNGNFIVRVTGKIGYEPKAGEDSLTKFKIGHNRDYMPFVHALEMDRISIEPAVP
jgi:hypothetical protein